MHAQTDSQLLRDYAVTRSEAAFTELVRRHVDLVYSAALRIVRDIHLAEDVTQAVFVTLVKSATQLTGRAVLSGWLHRTAQNIAAQTVRTIERRRARELEAVAMNQSLSVESDTNWENIAPHLDAALGELGEADLDAILLRYFERKSASEMAQTLGISDEAAQKRVNRAVERLREFFAKRGITVGASGLAVVITANAVHAAPIGLAATISTAAAVAGATITVTTAAKTIAMTTLQKSLITAALAASVGTGVYQARQASSLRTENAALRELTNQLPELAGLQATKQQLLEQLKTEQARPQAEHEEILRLRGRVAALRQAEQESVQTKTERDALAKLLENGATKLPEDDPGFQLRRDKMSYLSNWGLALKVYARTNDGRLPESLAAAAPSMPNSNDVFTSIGSRFRDDQFEMVYQGSLTNLGEPPGIIVVREREPVRASNGSWTRTYLFADGHTEIHFAKDGDFTAWEEQHSPSQSPP